MFFYNMNKKYYFIVFIMIGISYLYLSIMSNDIDKLTTVHYNENIVVDGNNTNSNKENNVDVEKSYIDVLKTIKDDKITDSLKDDGIIQDSNFNEVKKDPIELKKEEKLFSGYDLWVNTEESNPLFYKKDLTEDGLYPIKTLSLKKDILLMKEGDSLYIPEINGVEYEFIAEKIDTKEDSTVIKGFVVSNSERKNAVFIIVLESYLTFSIDGKNSLRMFSWLNKSTGDFEGAIYDGRKIDNLYINFSD